VGDEYPTDADLEKIQDWDWHDLNGLVDFVASLWHWPDFWSYKGRHITAHTGGWSGNESIVDALSANEMFWQICWISSRRGGHYVFELPKKSFWESPTARAEEIRDGIK